MSQIIYIDVLVLENFFMNYLLLYTINRFCKRNAKWWKLSIASFIGALYVAILFFPNLQILYSLLIKFMIPMIMIVIAFSPYTIKEFIKILVLFYIEAFIIAGSIFAIFYLSNKDISIINGAFLIDNISSNYIVIGSLIAIIMVKVGFDYFDNYYSMEKRRIELRIFLENRQCELTALVDTGNSLRDPMTNIPVVVVYTKSILEILPNEVKNDVISDQDYSSIEKKLMHSSIKNRLRLIPYKALGVENGLLIGIKVDLIMAKSKSKTSIVNEAVIALYNKPISNQGEYNALAYPEILK